QEPPFEPSIFFARRGTKVWIRRNPCGRLIPLPLSTGHTGRSCGDAGCALFPFVVRVFRRIEQRRTKWPAPRRGRPTLHAEQPSRDKIAQEAAARGVRILELRWKNSA